MPAFSKEHEQQHIERIREIMALKPRASIVAIQKALENDPDDPLHLTINYIHKLRNKIKAERIHRFDHSKVVERISEIQDRTETIIGQMWRILLDMTAERRDRISAAKTIIDAEHKLFEAQLNAGIFERRIGTFEIHHNLSRENKILIIHALANYGIINPKSGGDADREPRDAPRNGEAFPRLQNPSAGALPNT